MRWAASAVIWSKGTSSQNRCRSRNLQRGCARVRHPLRLRTTPRATYVPRPSAFARH